MSCDSLGSKERLWLCAGCGAIRDGIGRRPRLFWAEDERPILAIPAGYDDAQAECAFGWAIAEVAERRRGWLGLLRRVMVISDREVDVGWLDRRDLGS